MIAIGQILIALVCVFVIVVGLWLLFGGVMTKPDTALGIRKFHTFLSSLKDPCEEYKYFTEGHLIWSETSIAAIEMRIRENTSSQYSINSNVMLHPRAFLFNVDEFSKRVYFVTTTEASFDWDSVSHYEEYIAPVNVMGDSV